MVFPYLSPPASDGPVVRAFAHRGGSLDASDEPAPENTVAAFQHAVDLGYRYLETDVHRSADGVLVAFHDAGLGRVAGEVGSIANLTWNELREIDLGNGHRIPMLSELFETFPDARFNIDPKSDDSVVLLAQHIKLHGAIDRVCVGSFSDERIETLSSLLGPTLCTSPGPRRALKIASAALAGRQSRQAKHHGAMQIPNGYGRIKLSRRLVSGLQRMGLEVHVWTINDEATMRGLVSMGVDGLMSDNTELLKSVLIDLDRWSRQ